MRLTADTSVLVAAFASWHEHHELAFAAVGRLDAVVAHCLLETYSVLTRLPAPHRVAGELVASYLEQTFGQHDAVALAGAEQQALVSLCVAQGIAGGSVYDALIAATCARANLRLLTLDTRARPIYALLGADHQLLG